jgi:hypothetical protein
VTGTLAAEPAGARCRSRHRDRHASRRLHDDVEHGIREPEVRFIGINVCEMDAFKRHAIPVIADARSAIDELGAAVSGYTTSAGYRQTVATLRGEWDAEVARVCAPRQKGRLTQAAIIGAVNAFARSRDVVVAAAGSVPGDLHKLWRAREPNTYHLEYGYSCMGYEIAGGLGVKMADPSRDVVVMVGDGSYLMMAQEIVTSVQESCKLDHRPARQQRLRQHRRPLAIDRIGRLRHAVRLQGPDRSCRQRRVARRRRVPRGGHAGVRSCTAIGARGRATAVIYAPIDTSEGVPGVRILVERADRRGLAATCG